MNATFRSPLPVPVLAPLSSLLLAVAAPALGQSYRVTPITVPGATGLSVNALNDSGQVAGDYQAGSPASRAFLWSGGNVTDLGTLGGSSSRVYGLNNLGDVTGQSSIAGDAGDHAFLYTGGVMMNLGTLGAAPSLGAVINDRQQVAGYSRVVPGSLETHSFVMDLGGPLVDLGTLGGTAGSPAAINLMGQVVGSSSTPGDLTTHAYVSMGGMTLDLGTLGGTFSFATAINLFGQVTGGASTPGDAELHAFVLDTWSFTGMVDLGTLGGSTSQGYAINQAGQIIGDSTTAGDAETHAFLYAGGTMQDLGTLGGGYSSSYGLNNNGQVVGVSRNAAGQDRAFLWQNGVLRDLNSFLPAGSGWELQAAYYINNAGQIVGSGLLQGEPAWFMLTPGTDSNQAPVARAGEDQVFACATNTVPVTLDASGSTDPDGDTLAFEWTDGNAVLGTSAMLEVVLAPGVHTLTVRVTDALGARSEDAVTVTVGDTVAPGFPCPAGQTLPAGRNGTARVPNLLRGLVVSDNCTRAGALVRTQNPPAGTALGPGTHPVIITVTDMAGNAGTCTVPLLVVDVTAPDVNCPDSVTRRAGTNGFFAVPDYRNRVSDNCTPDAELVVVQTPAPGTWVGPGPHSVVVTATDAAGNVGGCTNVVTVVDRSAPAIRSLTADPARLVAGHGMVAVTLAIVATDNCDANPTSRILSITSSDPETGDTDTTSPDWHITGNLTVELRAERSAPRRNRVYSVKVVCTDASGNQSMRTVPIPVRAAE